MNAEQEHSRLDITPGPSRRAGIDTFRFISIVAVIVLHLQPYSQSFVGPLLNQMARFAVPYFFIVGGYFYYVGSTRAGHNAIQQLKRYGSRLLAIYIFWYLAYAYWPVVSPENWSDICQNGLKYEFTHETFLLGGEFGRHTLYYLTAGGRGYHLWFLPSLGMAVVLLSLSLRFDVIIYGFAFSVLLFVIALLTVPYHATALGLPFNFDARNGPFFSSIFVFIGALLAKYDVRVSSRVALLVVAFGLVAHLGEVSLLNTLYGYRPHDFVIGTVPFATGIALFAVSSDNFGAEYCINRLGQYSLGIYLTHLLVIYTLTSLDFWISSDGTSRVLQCLGVSLLLTHCLSWVPVFRKVVM